MSELRDIQHRFARSVLHGEVDGIEPWIVEDGISPAGRLAIYRNTARIGLTEALRMSFPVVDRLVGEAFFDMAAARYLRADPPRSAWLDEYGAGFPEFLRSLPEAASLRYLPDVARFEWQLGVAANAPPVPPLGLIALAGLDAQRLEGLRLAPHPSVSLLSLDFPADRIADAVLSGDDDAMAAIDLDSGPAYLAVHRGPDGVTAERIDRSTFRFLGRLFAGEALGVLLADAWPDASAMLSREFALGRIAGVQAGTSPPAREIPR